MIRRHVNYEPWLGYGCSSLELDMFLSPTSPRDNGNAFIPCFRLFHNLFSTSPHCHGVFDVPKRRSFDLQQSAASIHWAFAPCSVCCPCLEITSPWLSSMAADFFSFCPVIYRQSAADTPMSPDEEEALQLHGFRSSALGENCPTWLKKFAAMQVPSPCHGEARVHLFRSHA